MVFSRSQRMDRRRRIVRESAASDAVVAADYARLQKKAKKSYLADPEGYLYGEDAPDYSQDVRKPCQQRVVQWIPVRAQAVWTFIAGCWVIWGLLLAAHYLLHTKANSMGRSPIPVLQLLDLRSPHSIANWMTCQLWLLTAAASWMVYSIRQYRLDDFTATYRVWFVMIGLALFSCFDTATSATYLLGQSIDPWTRREIGYGGWPLLLAAYASIVALVGLRLSSEMRLSRSALWLWLGGLAAWGCAALLGTGLFKLQWDPGTIDLIVGGCWLGGVLAVFQAVGLVLRRCYMQAQRRFLERTVLAKPKLDWEFQDDPNQTDSAEENQQDQESVKKSWLPWRRRLDTPSDELETRDLGAIAQQPPKRPMRLFGLFPHRSERNEQLAGNEPLRIEDQVPVDQGLTKKPSWFARKEKSDKANTASTAASANPPSTDARQTPLSATASKPVTPNKGFDTKSTENGSTQKKTPDPASELNTKRSWLGSIIRRTPRDAAAGATSQSPDTKSLAAKSAPVEPKADKAQVQEASVKKPWFSMGKKNSDASSLPASTSPPQSSASKPQEKKPESAKAKEPETVDSFEILDEESPKSGKFAKRLFGWFEGLKLKPPKDSLDSTAQSASKSDASKTTSPAMASATSSANKPQPAPAEYDEEEDEEYEDYRNLSKAERKRLRRQQNDRGAA